MIKAVVEIPDGSKYKYEVDKLSGKLVVDRVLSVPSPANYGYIPDTLSEDGDPLDVFIIGTEALAPLVEVKLVIHGVLMCVDGGEPDEKLLATIEGDDMWHGDVGSTVTKIIEYLKVYKPGKMKLNDDCELTRHDVAMANQVLVDAKARYRTCELAGLALRNDND